MYQLHLQGLESFIHFYIKYNPNVINHVSDTHP